MDNFSAHELAIEQITEMTTLLTNTKVMWLLPNATSIYQPLDQGIIQNWKSYVKKQFVMFMAQTFDQGKDLLKEIDVLKAIRQGISTQENDVSPATIQNCWARSQCIDFGQFPRPSTNLQTESQELVESIRQGLYRLRQNGYLVDVPSVHDYISPYTERVVDDCPESLVDDIVAQYTQTEQEEDAEEVVIQEPVKHEEAMYALNILRKYEEQNQFGNLELLKMLRRHERDISSRYFQSRQQVSLDQWIVPRAVLEQ